MTYWRIRRGNTPMVGPVNTERVIRGIEAGRIPIDAEVQRVGDETWARIAQIPEFNEAYVSSGQSEPPTRILGSSLTPPADLDEGATRIMSPGALGAPPVPRGLNALPQPPKPPTLPKVAAARTTARAIPVAAVRAAQLAPQAPVAHAAPAAPPPHAAPPAPLPHAPPAPPQHAAPAARPADARSAVQEAFASDPPGIDDERTRIMEPSSRALPDVGRSRAFDGGKRPQRERQAPPEPSALHGGRLPPKPAPLSASTGDGVSQSDITQLRDAIEEDEAEEARRSQPTERPQHQSAGSAAVAIAVGAHIPGGDRAGRPAVASTPPSPELPSFSLHPDHDRTSPALRALRRGPERTIRILVFVILVLCVALGISIVMHLRG
jgi:hypothetical protein